MRSPRILRGSCPAQPRSLSPTQAQLAPERMNDGDESSAKGLSSMDPGPNLEQTTLSLSLSLPHHDVRCGRRPTQTRIKYFLFLKEHATFATLPQHARRFSTIFQVGYPGERPARSPKVFARHRSMNGIAPSLSPDNERRSRGSAMAAPIRCLQ